MSIRSFTRQHFGWHLVVGLLVFAAMTAVVAELSDQVMEGEPLTVTDAQLSNWLHVHSTPSQLLFFRFVTWLGSTVVATAVTLGVAFYLLWRKQKYWLATFVLSVGGGAILNRLLKAAFQRTRPQFDDPIMTFHGYSFPSGHTLTATVLYGCLAAIVVARHENKVVRVVAIVVALILMGMVGFSRIYLGAHYLTDVLAAMAEGLAWLAVSFTLVYAIWRNNKGLTISGHRTR